MNNASNVKLGMKILIHTITLIIPLDSNTIMWMIWNISKMYQE